MTQTYPKREPFFSHRFTRLLAKVCVAQELGPAGAWLLTVVVQTEDAARYRRAVTFYDFQLMPIIGVSSQKTLSLVRQKAVDNGWLHYEPGNKTRASKYWVTIPPHAEELDDNPTDEGESDNPSEMINGNFYGAKGDEPTGQTATNLRGKGGAFIPIPDPIPEYKEGSVGEIGNQEEKRKPKTSPAPAKAPPFDPLSVDLPVDLQTDQFRTAWGNWCQHRRDIRKPLTPTATRQQLTKLTAWGPERAVEAIETAINAGWSGLFEPKSKSTSKASGGKSGPFAAVTLPMMRDSRALMAWFDGQSLIPITHENRIWLLACAEKATDPEVKATNPTGLFVSLARDLAKGDRSKIGDQHYDRAKLRLKSLSNPSPNRSGSTENGPRSIGEVLAQ